MDRILRKTEDDGSTVLLSDMTTELPRASLDIFLVLFLHFRVTLHHFYFFFQIRFSLQIRKDLYITHKDYKIGEPTDQEDYKNVLYSENTVIYLRENLKKVSEVIDF